MKVDFTFKNTESSEAVTEHAQERIGKIEKFALNPMDIHFHFEAHKHEYFVNVTVVEGRRKFQAQAVSADFYRGIDNVVNKLLRQLSKDKRRLKNHKNVERSNSGKLASLSPSLEHDFHVDPVRKAS